MIIFFFYKMHGLDEGEDATKGSAGQGSAGLRQNPEGQVPDTGNTSTNAHVETKHQTRGPLEQTSVLRAFSSWQILVQNSRSTQIQHPTVPLPNSKVLAPNASEQSLPFPRGAR